LWADEFRELAARHTNFRFEPTLSQPSPSWQGRRGYVQAHFAELAKPRERIHVYICGPERMVEHCVAALTHELGLDPARIITEGH
jgi:NAD(P)H-flavin reductase